MVKNLKGLTVARNTQISLMKIRLSLIYCLFLVILDPVPAVHGKILNEWRFEDPKSGLQGLAIQGDRPPIIADPTNPGNKVMQAILRPGAKRPERSEVIPAKTNANFSNINFGEERWIAVRILRPQSDANAFLSSFQLGPISDKANKLCGALQLATYKDNIWTIRIHPGRIGNDPKGVTKKLSVVPFGKWETWVFHVKLSSNPNGFVQVWRDGVSVFEIKEMSAQEGDFMRVKWGAYVGKGNVPNTVIQTLFDDIVIGDETSSLSEVTSGKVAK
jgi:hypothetical protein